MNKQIIIVVFVLFLAPVVVATLLHSQWFSWQPGGTRNHGELIQPVIALPEFSLHDAFGQPLSRDDLLDQWQLVHWRSEPCTQTCLEDLYWLRQVRRAQDRHQPDIGLLLLTETRIEAEFLDQILELSDTFKVVHGSEAGTLAQTFPGDEQGQASYIVDPMANIILGYAADADPNDIRRDLRRLLTWTHRD